MLAGLTLFMEQKGDHSKVPLKMSWNDVQEDDELNEIEVLCS